MIKPLKLNKLNFNKRNVLCRILPVQIPTYTPIENYRNLNVNTSNFQLFKAPPLAIWGFDDFMKDVKNDKIERVFVDEIYI